GTMTINVTPVNDAPTTGNNAVTTPEDTTGTFRSASFPFSDVDAGDTMQSVRIDALPGNGTLTLGGNPVSAGQVIPVAQLGGLVYTPPADQNGVPYTTFTFSVSDGTVFSAAPATMTVNVTPVDDAPVNSVPGNQATPVNTPLVFSAGNGNAISVADVDAGSAPVVVTLTAGSGVVNVLGNTGGVTLA